MIVSSVFACLSVLLDFLPGSLEASTPFAFISIGLTGLSVLSIACVVVLMRRTSVTVMRSGRRYRMLRGAARLLPAGTRAEYLEEWLAWQWDLRASGASRWRRASEVLSILLRLPWLIVAAHLGKRVVS